MSSLNNMTVISDDGSIHFNNNIDNFNFSKETLSFLEGAAEAVSLFFSTEIDLDEYEDVDDDIITEIKEAILLGKFDDPIRVMALKEHLNIAYSEIEQKDEDGTEFEADGGEYTVLLDSEATDIATEYAKNLIEDQGVEALSEYARDYAYETFIDHEWFEDVRKESNESYAYDIKDESASDESFISRLHEEMVENGIMEAPEWPEEPDNANDEEITDWETETEEFRTELENEVEGNIDEFIDKMSDSNEDAVEWYRNNFGSDSIKDAVENNNLLNIDDLADWMVEQDGRGHFISHYDGNENEETVTYKDETETLYIYRTN